MALYFECSPLELDEEQVHEYLYMLKTSHRTPSESFFKHTMYGLRYAYQMMGMTELRVKLPSLSKPRTLPVVLSRPEVKTLLLTPKLLKHRLLLALLYGCGLRSFELRNLKIKDVDLHRQMLHVRQGKGRKDRYVPLGKLLCRGISTYLEAEKPLEWLFNGNRSAGKIAPLSQRGVQWVVRQARDRSRIAKDLTAHTLRHSYATHLLEMGLDIVPLKELLGHSKIETALVYLHVSQLGRQKPFSPLDHLYESGP